MLVDLAGFNLPSSMCPRPVYAQYQHEETKRWRASVSAAHAYVFVAGIELQSSAGFLNVLDYFHHEWLSRGALSATAGASGGIRAVQVRSYRLLKERLLWAKALKAARS